MERVSVRLFSSIFWVFFKSYDSRDIVLDFYGVVATVICFYKSRQHLHSASMKLETPHIMHFIHVNVI